MVLVGRVTNIALVFCCCANSLIYTLHRIVKIKMACIARVLECQWTTLQGLNAPMRYHMLLLHNTSGVFHLVQLYNNTCFTCAYVWKYHAMMVVLYCPSMAVYTYESFVNHHTRETGYCTMVTKVCCTVTMSRCFERMTHWDIVTVQQTETEFKVPYEHLVCLW